MGFAVKPGTIRVGFLEEVVPKLNVRGYTSGRQAKAVHLTNTASSDQDHAGLKDYWWGGKEGEMKIELSIKKMMAFEPDFER